MFQETQLNDGWCTEGAEGRGTGTMEHTRNAHQERSCAAGTEQTRWINIICFYSSFQPTSISLGQLLKGGFAELPPPWFSIVNCWALTAEEDESFTAQRGRCDVEQVRGDPGHQESPVNRKVMGFALPAAVFLRPLAGETQGVPLG